MSLFAPDNRNRSPRHQRAWAIYEIAHTGIDFTAAILFLVGSVMFFSEALMEAATWCFVIGSVAFALKPTIRLGRELHLVAIGDYERAAPSSEGPVC